MYVGREQLKQRLETDVLTRLGKERIIETWWRVCCKHEVMPPPLSFPEMIEQILDAEHPTEKRVDA